MRAQQMNLVGPQVRRLRVAKNWTQEALTAACQRTGWDVARSCIGKIESRLRRVTDIEAAYLAEALGCRVGALFEK